HDAKSVGKDRHLQFRLLLVRRNIFERVVRSDGDKLDGFSLVRFDQLVALGNQAARSRAGLLVKVEDEHFALKIVQLVLPAIAKGAGREIGSGASKRSARDRNGGGK